jgi:hypothetical protein
LCEGRLLNFQESSVLLEEKSSNYVIAKGTILFERGSIVHSIKSYVSFLVFPLQMLANFAFPNFDFKFLTTCLGIKSPNLGALTCEEFNFIVKVTFGIIGIQI